MPTCSFFADDRSIDESFDTALRKAVRDMVEAHDEIKFLFTGSFQEPAFLAAALEAKQRYPQKLIRLTLVQHTTAAKQRAQPGMPCCAFDRILPPPVGHVNDRNFIAAHRQLRRWVMDQSDYLLCYCYKELCYEKRLYQHALQRTAPVIDLTQPETAAFLQDRISRMPLEEQSIKQLADQGISSREIAGLLHLSAASVSHKLRRISHALREDAKKRMDEQACRNRCYSCGLISFAPGGALTPEQQASLRQTVAFLIQRFGSILFVADRTMRNTALVRTVLDLADAEASSAAVVVCVHCAKGDRRKHAALSAQLVPPFADILPMDTQTENSEEHPRRTMTGMLCQSDFVICGDSRDRERVNALLSDVDESIRAKFACPLKIFDLSNEPAEV